MKKLIRLFAVFGENFAWRAVFLVLIGLFLISDRLALIQDFSRFNLNGWIGMMYDIVPLYFLMLSPLLILGRYAKFFYIPFFSIEIFLQALGWFTLVKFKMILDGDWIGIVFGSSLDEMWWFVREHMSAWLILSILLLMGLIIAVVKLSIVATKFRVTKETVTIGVLSILLFGYANKISDVCVHKKYMIIEKQIFGIHLIADSIRNINDFKLLADMKLHPRIPDAITIDENLSGDVVGVVILGESATRSHWSLYGYERETTPCMDLRKNELIVFKDLVTPIGSTAGAMRYIFTTRTIEHPSDMRFTMAQCLKHVGYDVAMFSNQARWGEWDGDESFDFAGCDPFLFMKEQGGTNCYDEVLLSYCANYLLKASNRTIVFLHLIGSHVPAVSCYPPKCAPFTPENFEHSSDDKNPVLNKNHYDNSIWYTDKILGQVIAMLERLHKPSWMIYLSDHGETPSASSWRSQLDNDLYEVPFIVWTSEEFLDRYPWKITAMKEAAKLPLQSDQLLYGLLDFCGVCGAGNEPWENFLSPKFRCRERRVVGNGYREYIRGDMH